MTQESGKNKGFVNRSLGKLGLDTLFYTSDENETAAYAREQEPRESSVQAELAEVTPMRRVTPTYAAAQPAFTDIETLRPRSFSEAPRIAELLRDSVPVVLDLSNIADPQAQRIIDFASGVVLGVNGGMKRITGKVFMITPESVNISEGDPEHAAVGYSDSGSFFVAKDS